jgi:ribosomal protein S18 acetylase RimI-like enzyme
MMARQPRIRFLARRAWRVLQSQGLRGAWIKLLDVSFHRRLLVLECRVDDARSFQRSGFDGPVTHGVLTRDGIDDYLAFRMSEEDELNPAVASFPKAHREHVERRLDAGCVCFTASIQGEMVAGVWAAVGGGDVEYLRCALRLDPQAVYLHDLYTRPAQRGLGLAPGLIAGMAEHFQAAGCRRLVALVLPENEASLRSLGRVGFRCVGRAGYWGFGRLRWLFCTAPGCSLVSLP